MEETITLMEMFVCWLSRKLATHGCESITWTTEADCPESVTRFKFYRGEHSLASVSISGRDKKLELFPYFTHSHAEVSERAIKFFKSIGFHAVFLGRDHGEDK